LHTDSYQPHALVVRLRDGAAASQTMASPPITGAEPA
jgi:hypothetical protein